MAPGIAISRAPETGRYPVTSKPSTIDPTWQVRVAQPLPANAPAWIDRLLRWLEPFESSFGHVAQRGAFRRYLLGLLSDGPRKSMSAMLARVSDPGSYQAFQHFLTHAPWDAERLWRRLRAQVPAPSMAMVWPFT